eukprot:4722817-Alexandrium_andersonii.AAC.1
MSASLVGSEMCIRDRSSPQRELQMWWTTMGGAIAGNGRPRWATTGRHGSVSYTHLTLPTICSV